MPPPVASATATAVSAATLVDAAPATLAEQRIDALLPQTQCTRCGYDDCRTYAEAITAGNAAINRCPPGGAEGITRLAALTGLAASSLDPACGVETERSIVWIDEAWCIGCTLCILACPMDCIVGANKRMHTVVESDCTGCELCLPVCPVDCIQVESATPGHTGWQAWSPAQANAAKQRYDARQARQQRLSASHAEALAAKAQHKLAHLAELTKANTPSELDRKRSIIEAALARARQRRAPT